MGLAAVTLDDKYEREQGTVYITGSQALVRLAMTQIARDHAAGLETACFISGYRGSPMHNIDKELWRAQRHLTARNIHFQPAVNEDLAATAVWGSQQVTVFPEARYDGVAAMWYGKGPGLDRSIDAIRHANLHGTAAHGGVLAMVGDDHAQTSTDVPANSEATFLDLMMPMLFPATVEEILTFGLYGFALSRFCGAWVGYKTLPDTLDTSATIPVDLREPRIVIPTDFELPPGGLNLRAPDDWRALEGRLRNYKLPAAIAFARANALNRVVVESPRPRYGIIASGKVAIDVDQALADLGLDPARAADAGISILRIGMPHPLDLALVREFARGLEEVLVVEEKRRLIEIQVKDALYALPDDQRPRVVGHHDESGAPLLTVVGELDPDTVARVIAPRIAHFHAGPAVQARLAFLDEKARAAAAREVLGVTRIPYFCSGCPHNTSTRVPEGSRAYGGVGCHFMATYMDRDTITYTHMGGEGAPWIGQAPFTSSGHVFQNLGDGTYYHSGLLAIRACVAANVSITYKILFNDAVAMTGGQPLDGPLSPDRISHQVYAEGVRKIAVVTDEPEKYPRGMRFAPGTVIEHRRALDRVQRELREYCGVSVIIYDQTCAAEKRRRRKRGELVDPPTRVFINERVCEGCGDCSERSNCLSVIPHETEFGRKRRIDQSSCNKDYSCREGFCPSFVSVVGGMPRRLTATAAVPSHLRILAEPDRPALRDGAPYSILVTGVGGTGVVTVGAMLTMAAHLEGKACAAMDQFGMAQKGGAVASHVRLANRAEEIHAVRLNAGAADLVLGCDSLVAGSELALDAMRPERTRAVVNRHETITGDFTRNPDLRFPAAAVEARIRQAAGGAAEFLDATRLATALLGNAISTNLFMLGYAYQKGLIPVTSAAIERAIELNDVAVDTNREAFAWGRRAAVDLAAVTALAATGPAPAAPADLDERVEQLVAELTAYQNAGYARRYRALVEHVRRAEREQAPGQRGLGEAVARYAYKLMAYKDEYEVARLFTDGAFRRALETAFEGDYRIEFHLAPPLLAGTDPETGRPRKRTYGPWMMTAMKLLARLRWLRGTAFDPFGRTPERRRERRLWVEYEARMTELADALTPDNHALAVEIASLPEQIRGYGFVKERHLAAVEARAAELVSAWREAPRNAA